MNPDARDLAYMRQALALAARGLGGVEPNPMVGAIVVRDDRVVGQGWHARFGGPHAEVVALGAAGDLARGAELFVTLEPCCHHGKTPPCTDAILRAGVRRVVAAVTDPFPQVAGRGERCLRDAGLEVTVGVLADEARRLNAAYFKRCRTGMPLVIVKWAMTLDGRIATASGDSRWISCDAARRRAHEVRRIVDAVRGGAATAAKDAPSLTVRHVAPLAGRGQPTRVVLDASLSLDPGREPAASAREVPVLVYAAADAPAARADALRRAGCQIVTAPVDADRFVSPRFVLEDLGRRGMSRVLVEGGAHVFGSFLKEGLADRAMIFVAPRLLGTAGGLCPVVGLTDRGLDHALALEDLQVERVDTDLLIEGRLGEF